MGKVALASRLFAISFCAVIAFGCDSTRKLTKPAGPLKRNIVGRYKNYNTYWKGYNLAENFLIEISQDSDVYRGTYRIATRQAYHSNGRVSYAEGEYFDPITSGDEIIFRSKISVYCEAWRTGEFNKKITDWKEDEFGEPNCSTEDDLARMNADRQNPEVSGAYFRLIGDDELWLGDEDLPVKLRKVPARDTEIVE